MKRADYTVQMFRYFIRTLPANIIGSFRGKRIIFHIIAIIATVIIVQSNLDWRYLVAIHNIGLMQALFPAVIIGGFLPVSLPFFMIVLGYLYDRPRWSVTGWAIGQAALIGSIISSAYKALTGRTQPDLTQFILNSSHGFHFGLFRHGIFWGWPSSHTTIAFAMACAVIVLYPRRRVVAVCVIAYAFYIGIGVSFSIHWLSEFVAGAFIGIAIGIAVGRSFQKQLKAK